MVFLILMIFGSKKVSSIDVLKYYSDKHVLRHYEAATGAVGLWESEKVVSQKSIKNRSIMVSKPRSNFQWVLDTSWIDFGAILHAKLAFTIDTKGIQNHIKTRCEKQC